MDTIFTDIVHRMACVWRIAHAKKVQQQTQKILISDVQSVQSGMNINGKLSYLKDLSTIMVNKDQFKSHSAERVRRFAKQIPAVFDKKKLFECMALLVAHLRNSASVCLLPLFFITHNICVFYYSV